MLTGCYAKGEGSEKVNGLIKRLHLSAAVDDAPDEDAEHGDLVLEAGEIMGVEVLKVGGAKAVIIKAVFESVGVTKRGAGSAVSLRFGL